MNYILKLLIPLIIFITVSFIGNSQCNTNISICTAGVAGPFTFANGSANPSSCLDFTNGAATPNYAYIILYITQGGDLNLLIDGDQATGCLDVSIFDITGVNDPCASLGLATEIGCNYASACDGCNEFGTSFPCASEVPAPVVNAGDVIMILVEDWNATMTNFTLELSSVAGSAQTGPPDATINQPPTVCATSGPIQLTAADNGGDWSGPGISPTGEFDPAAVGVGTYTINYTIGSAPCDDASFSTIEVIDCTVPTPCPFYENTPTAELKACGGQMYDFSVLNTACPAIINFDVVGNYGSQDAGEITWEVLSVLTGNVVASGGPGGNGNGILTTVNVDPNVEGTVFNLIVYDSWGDGFNGGGGFIQIDDNGVITAGPLTGNFGDEWNQVFASNIDISPTTLTVTTPGGDIVNNIGNCADHSLQFMLNNANFCTPINIDLPWEIVCDITGSVISSGVQPVIIYPQIPSSSGDIVDITWNAVTCQWDVSPQNDCDFLDIGLVFAITPDPSAWPANTCVNGNQDFTIDYIGAQGSPDCCSTGGALVPIIYNATTNIADPVVANSIYGGQNNSAYTVIPASTIGGDATSFDVTIDWDGFCYNTPDNNPDETYYVAVWVDGVQVILNGPLTGGGPGTMTIDETDLAAAGVTYNQNSVIEIYMLPNNFWVDPCGFPFTPCPIYTVFNPSASCTPSTDGEWTMSQFDVIVNVTFIEMTSGPAVCTFVTPSPYTCCIIDLPTASNPANINVECSGGAPAVDVSVVTDEASPCNPVVTFEGDASDGLSCPETITRTYRITDDCGNFTDVQQLIIIGDVTPPVLFAPPAAVTVQCGAIPPMVNLNWTDNCDGAGFVPGIDGALLGGNCGGTIIRTWTYSDGCGNSDSETQIITVEDITAPTFAGLPGASAVECIGDVPAMIDLTWNDNCDGTGVVTGSDASNGNTCPETITRTWTYTDACGNIATVSQIITVDDTIDPTATDPSPQVGLPPFFDPTQVTDATDNCGVPTITAGGDISDGGTCPEIITRTYIITDACGNFITVEQTFTVGDPVNPTATDPLPMNVECVADVLGPDATVVTDENDNGSTPIVTWEDDNSDGNTCPETILRRYRVTDDCGNFIFVTQIITVEDITAPTFSGLPGASSVECIGDVPAMIDLTWNDNCDGTGVVTGSDASDGNTCPEVITRTWTYTDACGNIATVSQLISVGDTQIPVFVPQPIDVAVQCSADVPVAADLAWNDNCDGTGMSVATDISDGLSCPETITRTWTYTDACGNNASVSQIITVEDTQAPLLALPLNAAVVSCTADIPAMVDLNYTDNCDAPGSVTGVDVSDGLSCPETITRTWTYTDACGNNATASQTIVVNDLINPTASNPTAISVPGSMDVPAPDVAVVTDEADNCTLNPIVTIEGADVSDGNVCNGEIITRTYRVTDDCGNFILVTQQITIEATYPPISIDDQVICEGSSTTLTAVNPMNVPISWDNGVQDGVSFTPTQTTLYTVTADNLGCISTASATVTLEEIPMVDFTADTLSGCEPLTVVFTNLSVAGASGSLEACIWDIEGASNSISGCGDVSYTFGSEGLYDVTLTTISSTGCSNTLTLFDYIYVEDLPVASFTLSDGVVSTLDTEVDFINTSTGADNYQWTFGDGTIGSTDVDPSHIFPDIETNGYSVELIAYSQNGCSDTARLIVLVEEELIFYVPNTFTPDGDAFNNIFQPVFTSGFDPFDFNMLIFNRWGEVIFETNDATVGWDGTYLSGQGLVQDGTYTWRIEFKQTKNDKRFMKTGQVTILK